MMKNDSLSYYFDIHDPNFHLNTYVSMAIPRAKFRVILGEFYIGTDFVLTTHACLGNFYK